MESRDKDLPQVKVALELSPAEAKTPTEKDMREDREEKGFWRGGWMVGSGRRMGLVGEGR